MSKMFTEMYFVKLLINKFYSEHPSGQSRKQTHGGHIKPKIK